MNEQSASRPQGAMSNGGYAGPRGMDPRSPGDPGRGAPPGQPTRGSFSEPRPVPTDPRGVGDGGRGPDPRMPPGGPPGGMIDPRGGGPDPRGGGNPQMPDA